MASGPITSWQIEEEKVEVVTDFLFLGSKITADSDCCHEIRRRLLLGRKAMTNLDSVLKSSDVTLLTTNGPYSQGCGLPTGHEWFWELDLKQGRAPKNWCLWTLVLEKTPESPLDSKENKLVSLPWILIGRTDGKAEWSSSILVTWCEQPTHWKSPWCWEGLRASEDEMTGWHHQCSGCKLGQTSGDGEGQWDLACCSPWGCKELGHDWATEQQQSVLR